MTTNGTAEPLTTSPAPPSQSSVDLPASSAPDTEPSPAPTSEPPSSAPVSLPTSDPAPTTQQPSSTPEPPSSAPEPSSSEAPPSSAAAPSSPAPSTNPDTTSTVTAQPTPTSTQIITSVVTPSATRPDETPTPITIIETVIKSSTPNPTTNNDGNAASPASSGASSTDPASLQNPQNKHETGGLSPAGKTAIAVVIPVVAVALLLLAGLWFWRKRKSNKSAEEARRKEVEEYGFNPNEDPTLPAVGMHSEMAEDQSGYRGWGNTATSSNRKASTTLTSGMTYSDSNSNPGDAYANPGSPTHAYSDAHSADPLVNGRRETLDSDGIGALGAAPVAGQNQAGVARGPSNASSSYSAAERSDNSGDYPHPMNHPQEYYDNNGYYPSSGPYDNSYGGGQQPIIRDVSARRNTRIENPSVFPQQGNSGIAQNF